MESHASELSWPRRQGRWGFYTPTPVSHWVELLSQVGNEGSQFQGTSRPPCAHMWVFWKPVGGPRTKMQFSLRESTGMHKNRDVKAQG